MKIAPRQLPITYSLIALNCLVYALQWIIPDYWVFRQLAYNPLVIEITGQWWRAFTAGFVHSQNDLSHLLMNMFSLWLFGQAIEPLLARWKYVLIYCGSILGGSALIWVIAAFQGSLNVTTVGASGGVFGLFGAYFVLTKLRGNNATPILILIAIQLGYGFFISGVSWEGHLGGLIAGVILTWLLQKIPSPATPKYSSKRVLKNYTENQQGQTGYTRPEPYSRDDRAE